MVKWFLSNGDIYEGDVSGGKYNGKGKYQWKNGEVYEGSWVNGQINKNQVVQLASWNNGSFKEMDKKSVNNLILWTEGNGLLIYEEVSRAQTPNGDFAVILNDLNGRSGMQVKLTHGFSYWKYPNDALWNILNNGSWLIKPVLLKDIKNNTTNNVSNTTQKNSTIQSPSNGISIHNTNKQSGTITKTVHQAPSGYSSTEKTYMDGVLINEKLIRSDGKLLKDENFSNGKLHGIRRAWEMYAPLNKTPILIVEDNYENGKLNGLSKRWHFNGQLESEGINIDDLRNGIWKFWDESGKILTEGKYEKGKREGNWCSKDVSGNKLSEGIYINDLAEGKWNYYHNNSKLSSEGQFSKNLQEGIWKSWHPNGILSEEGNFKNGKKEGLWKQYHANGKLSSEGQYVNNLQEGNWKSWHPNGQLSAEGNMKFGKKEGLWKQHSDNGIILTSGSYLNDKKNGIWKSNNLNGVITSEESYKNGIKDGIWITRHGNGVKSSEATYKEGTLVGEIKRFDEKGNLIKPQVVTNNNVNQSNSNSSQNYTQVKEKCFNCKGTGNCEYCTIFFNTTDWGGKSRGWVTEQKTNPGYVMCTGCRGSGRIYGIPFANSDPTYKDCPACSNGWQKCNKCYWHEIAKCARCNGSGYSE